MAAGDHIYVVGTIQGIPFQHHGIDAGDGSVIHLCAGDGARVTLKDSSERFSVRRTSIQEFANGREIFVKQHSDGRNGEQVVKEAEKRIGECGYNLLEGNCEHFATACATGR